MDDYLCVTLLSDPAESEAAFKLRLSALWTHMLRNHDAVFQKVYAETSACESDGDRLSRKYLVEAIAADDLEARLRTMKMDYEPIDVADLFSKYEATPPEWFWIEH